MAAPSNSRHPSSISEFSVSVIEGVVSVVVDVAEHGGEVHYVHLDLLFWPATVSRTFGRNGSP
jgi:hypothetical protein